MFSTRAHANVRGFSLVELLVVIAIIGILLAVGVGMLGGSPVQARKAAMDVLQSAVEQARTRALTRGSYTALAFIGPNDAPGGDPRIQRIGIFEILEWPEVDAASIETLDVRQVGRWQTLDSGIVLIEGTGSVELPNPLDSPRKTLRIVAGDTTREIQARVMVFHPRGGLRLPVGSEPIVLRLAEGSFRDGEPFAMERDGVVRESTLRVGRVIARPYRND